MRVLIADDQRTFGTALADMVRYCGHEVVAVVGSGLEAIHAFTLHKPDLVLLDYRMPKLNGATACRYILARDPTARVVLVSAWSPLDGADDSGAMCFLPKPVDLARLNATLLTISQSLPAPELVPNEESIHSPRAAIQNLTSTTIVPFVPIEIPQEIISPIENFPISHRTENEDVDLAQSPKTRAASPTAVRGHSPFAERKPVRKARTTRARKKPRRVS
jgi:two-component system chemotaxis response regulator CheY